MDKLQFLKRYKYPFCILFPTLYIGLLSFLYQLIFKDGMPIYVSAPITAVISLPITFLCLYLGNGVSKLAKWAVFALLYPAPVLFWYIVSRAAYVWNSYLGGSFFLSLSIYLSAFKCAVWYIGIAVSSLLTVILFKLFGRKK